MKKLIYFIIGLMLLSNIQVTLAANNHIVWMEPILEDDTGTAITTAQDIRLSLWKIGSLYEGDISGAGTLNLSSVFYAGYNIEITDTPDSLGRLQIEVTALAAFPDLEGENQFLMIEYKDTGGPDTDYTIYRDSYIKTKSYERFPLIENGVYNIETVYSRTAMETDNLILDYYDNAGAGDTIGLQFGSTLAETLAWDIDNSRFSFSDALRVEGNLAAVGEVYIAEDHAATDSDGTINLGRIGSTWQTLSFDYTNGEFDISNDLNFGQNELRGAVMENLASAPSTPIVGQMYYNTTDNQTYMYANTGWEPMGYHAHTHVNGEDDIQLATATQKGLMSAAYALELESLSDESDEINRNTIDHDLTLGENVVSGVAYLTYENPDDVNFVANIENIEFTILNNTSPGIALTGGTDANPALNYVYVKDTGVVEASTTDPDTQAFDWVPIAEVLVGTVGPTTATYYYIENLTNFIRNFIKDVNNRLREDFTIWLNGINLTTSGLDVAVTSGEVMHIHETITYPAQDTSLGDTILDEFYNIYTQLDNTYYDDGSGGDTIIGNNKFHKTFIWGDIYGGLHISRQRKPTTSEYTSLEQAISDPDHVAINAIPTEWEYVGFPIAHIVLNEASGVAEIIDLRSGGVAGGGGGGGHAQNTDVGTDSDIFTLDSDNTAADISLIFGSTLNETLTWNDSELRFDLSDDLYVDGAITTTATATKYMWLDIGGAIRTSASMGSVGGGKSPVVRFNSADNSRMRYSFPVPDDWEVGTDITVRIYWSPSDNTSGDVDFDLDFSSFAISDTISGGTFADVISGAIYETVNVTTELDIYSFTTNLPNASISADEMINIRLSRTPGDIGDTYAGSVNIHMIQIEYTGKKLL